MLSGVVLRTVNVGHGVSDSAADQIRSAAPWMVRRSELQCESLCREADEFVKVGTCV